MSNWIDEAMWQACQDTAASREIRVKAIARSRLPRLLRPAVERPRVLALIYRLRPTYRPTVMTCADGGMKVSCMQDASGHTYVFTDTSTIA